MLGQLIGEYKTKAQADALIKRMVKRLPHMKGRYKVVAQTRYMVVLK